MVRKMRRASPVTLTVCTERKTLPELKQGNDLLGRKIYDEAHAQYLRVIDSILGIAFRIPLPQDQDGGVKCEKYMQLCMDDRINLMACCNGIAKCLVGTEKRTEVNPGVYILTKASLERPACTGAGLV